MSSKAAAELLTEEERVSLTAKLAEAKVPATAAAAGEGAAVGTDNAQGDSAGPAAASAMQTDGDVEMTQAGDPDTSLPTSDVAQRGGSTSLEPSTVGAAVVETVTKETLVGGAETLPESAEVGAVDAAQPSTGQPAAALEVTEGQRNGTEESVAEVVGVETLEKSTPGAVTAEAITEADVQLNQDTTPTVAGSQDATMEAAPAGEDSAMVDAALEKPASLAAPSVTDDELKLSWFSLREETFKQAKLELTKRKPFEDGIKRPYFHVKPLDTMQLTNWNEYLDFSEKQEDVASTVTIYERCLVACASYPGAENLYADLPTNVTLMFFF